MCIRDSALPVHLDLALQLEAVGGDPVQRAQQPVKGADDPQARLYKLQLAGGEALRVDVLILQPVVAHDRRAAPGFKVQALIIPEGWLLYTSSSTTRLKRS